VAFLDLLSDGINRWVERLLVLLGTTMAAVVAAQVFFRYGLNRSLFWSEELARYQLVWLSFLGATVAYRRQANPSIDALYRRLPPGAQQGVAIVAHLCALGLFGIMVVYGSQFAHFVRTQISPALHLPKWLPHAVIPLSGSILLVHALAFLLHEIRGSRR
jgi:TRAP-type C4-dicarboxylate transport system permease small subunit